ncbi:MAG TPA: DUF1573 domain-containing protein, partial [Flavobacteriales bacterium]|nr:DUF1573 domain-containing protein [Flavobacteriales bacterium]
MKENVKIFLLSVIAIGVLANAYYLSSLVSATDKENEPEDEPAGVVANNVSGNAPTSTGTDNMPTMANPANVKTTTVQWAKMVHDFGNVKQNSTNSFDFEFTNTGTEPLQITDAKGSCGCTVPEYPKEPVMPGETGKIHVEYKPGEQ